MDDNNYTPIEYGIKLINRDVTLMELNSGREMSRVLKTLRTDGPQYNFMNYLLIRPNTVITRADINENVNGCKLTADLTEIVRLCGFSKHLKSSSSPFVPKQN